MEALYSIVASLSALMKKEVSIDALNIVCILIIVLVFLFIFALWLKSKDSNNPPPGRRRISSKDRKEYSL